MNPKNNDLDKGKQGLTWDDIIASFQKSIDNSPGETEQEKLAYFKRLALDHLDKVQEEETKKKVIPFPNSKKE